MGYTSFCPALSVSQLTTYKVLGMMRLVCTFGLAILVVLEVPRCASLFNEDLVPQRPAEVRGGGEVGSHPLTGFI